MCEGHGEHLTGLGHVKDLAVAMAQVQSLHTHTPLVLIYGEAMRRGVASDAAFAGAWQVIGREQAKGQVYNIQVPLLQP